MASEDIFEHEFSEEPGLGQELNGADDEAMQAEDEEGDEAADKQNAENGAETESPSAANDAEPSKAAESSSKATADQEHEAKLTQLPLARIRNIMKLDPDVQVASNEAVFAVAKAVELFVESLARESYSYTAQAKKKTIQKRDVDLAIAAVDSLMFLDGAMNF